VKKVNDEVRIQALVDGKRVNIKESSIRRILRLDNAQDTSCLTNTEFFEGLARMGAKTTSWNEFSSTMASAIICLATNQKFNFSMYILLSLVKNIEAGVPFFMFPRFVQLIINHQLGDMTHHKDIFDTPSLTKNVFANIKRVGTGFFREVTPLFDIMLVQALKEVGTLQADAQPIPIPTEPLTSEPQKKHKPKRKHTKEPKVPPIESQAKYNVPLPSPSYDPLPSGEDSLKLKELMDLCTNLSNKVLDLESEVIDIKSTYKEKIEKLESRVERLEEENMVLKDLKGVHSTVDSDEPVMEKEESSKQEKKIAVIDADVEINLEKVQVEAYNLDLDHQEKVLSMLDVNNEEPAGVKEVLEVVTAAKLITEVVTTAGVDVNAAVFKILQLLLLKQLKSESLIDSVMKYQALKGKSLTEAQARRNMIVYLKNMAGYKMNYFKRMSYDEIRPLFEKHYNYNQAFLNEVNEGIKFQEKEKQKMEQETEELKKCLQIVPEDDDDVYENTTPLALKILIVDYKIHTERNKPYFKIIRADGNHKLFMSFSTMMKNFDREDLESFWKIVRERFEKTEPNNFTDDYLVNTLKIMFEKPNVEANIFLLVEKMYPLTYFTLEQMVNDVRLEVNYESEMSLELLWLVRRQLNEGNEVLGPSIRFDLSRRIERGMSHGLPPWNSMCTLCVFAPKELE
nr:hypothetical protein [Tanacetum cinerariifolium]